MKSSCLLEQFKKRPSYQSSRPIDSSTSETKISLKYKERTQLRRALVPASCRIKFVSTSTLHSRVDERFDRLYNTSPRRKIQKLKEARRSYQVSARPVLKQANKRTRSFRQSTDAIKHACDKWLETKGTHTLQLKHARSVCQQARAKALSFLYTSENDCASQVHSFQAPHPRKHFSLIR